MVRLFRVFIPTSVLALLISEAVLIFSCYVVATFCLLDSDPTVYLLSEGGLWRIAAVVGCVMLGIYFHDLYTQFRIRSQIVLVQQVCLVVGIAFLTQALFTYLKRPEWALPKWQMILGSGLVLVLLPVWRIVYASVVMKAIGSERLLFLGSSAVVRQIGEHLAEHPEIGLSAIGYLDDCQTSEAEFCGIPRMGCLTDLAEVVAKHHPDRIVLGMSERRGRMPVSALLEMRFSGIKIEDALTTYETTFGRICVRELRPSQLIFSAELGPRDKKVFWQSIYSFAIAVIAAIATAPIMLLVAVVIKMSSRGPVFFRQRRVGRNGSEFTLYKFRSMYANAEASTGAVWAVRDDPRITPVGRVLRKLRLDELPQFFNVIKGEMSIVGPRPERPEFVETLIQQIPYYRQRHCVKPGITGWAQINHKYGDTIEDTVRKLEFDLYYIKNLAPSLDVYIIFHTLKVMLLSRGAQ
jgi:exopolysaccharide biosynthesis polyprenyl glycosylphosphotransferase